MTAFWTWLLSVLGTLAGAALALTVPVIRDTVGKYLAGLVQHRFDERIKSLKSELRQTEQRFSADLRAKEQQLASLTNAALTLRSSRQAALDARRLQAVKKLWAAKIASDRMKMAANSASHLNWEKVFEAADDPKLQQFAQVLLMGLDLAKGLEGASALTEQPFLPPNVWALFSAYQRVMTTSVLFLTTLSKGATTFLKKEDLLKPLMLSVLPEYKDYIEQYGFSGYYLLLDALEQKLLNAITAMLEGKDLDDATIRRTAEIMSAVQAVDIGKKSNMPEELRGFPAALRGPDVPNPPKR